jgi:hypothetical protein
MDATTERRSMERRWCKCVANWSYFNRESSLPGQVLNFSQAGSYLETARPIIPGTTVLIRLLKCSEFIREQSEGLRLNAVAEVKWCREMKDMEKAWYGVGVRYHFPV